MIGTNPRRERRKRAGSTVQITVSKGPELVTVPDLMGMTLEAAQAQLVALGLDVDTVGYLPGRLVREPDPGREPDGQEGHQGHADLLTAF